MIPIFAALQFLTIFPAIVRRQFSLQELGRSTGWYPLVGLALGSLLFGVQAALQQLFPVQVSAVVVLGLWLLFTRALHFDGFIDSCDGLFGGFTPERRLEILRDSRVGAFGVAGGVFLLLSKYVALSHLANPLAGLLLAPTFGRWGLTVSIFAFPYGRKHGLGREIKDNTSWPQVVLATLISLPAVWLAGSWWIGLAAFLSAGLVLCLVGLFVLRRIPGLTGDSYGAICELIELVVLLVFAVVFRGEM
ncbi:MAG: adenosylcobinamide-GDP ribazoletransferase [Anaerolineales bacterium]|nr:adenosylcobinamide-GDP ribazoletransferase [Anaerolineales bacterium]